MIRTIELEGFAPLLEAFVPLKRQAATSGAADTATRRVALSRLVLAGPDPAAIADDPEGQGVLDGLCQRWLALEPELQRQVALLALPMDSRENNALIVNALQRCSSVVVQNSLREHFGLTATEAMLKGASVLGTRAAGLRAQIQDSVHGRLVDDPEDPQQVASALRDMLDDPDTRSTYGRNARRRAAEHYVTPRQVRSWLELIGALQAKPSPTAIA
ncbi:MAG: glycosyltransferase [Myxococcales bacterium]|jgi:trehalose synthase